MLVRFKDFTDNLISPEVLAPAHIFQDSDSEHSTKVASTKHIIFRSLPERPKLRRLLENENNESLLHKTHWRSFTSSRKVWWQCNGRSQCPRWGTWIWRQSPVRCGGARSCHSTDSILRDGRRVTRKECNRLREEFWGGWCHGSKKGLWILAKKRMLEDRGCLPRKDGDVLREENFFGSWMREDVEGKEERENVNKAAEEEARKREKERWREKEKGLRPKESVWILCPARVFEVLCPDSEVQSVGNSWVLRCVCAVCLWLFFSRMWMWMWSARLFSLIRIVHLWSRRPFCLSLQKTRSKFGFGGWNRCEQRKGPLVEAEPGAVRSRPAP